MLMVNDLRSIAILTIVTAFIGFIISIDMFFILPPPAPITPQEFIIAWLLFTGFIEALIYAIIKDGSITIQRNDGLSLREEALSSIAIGFSLYIGIFLFTGTSSLISQTEIPIEQAIIGDAISSLLLSIAATLTIFLLIHFSGSDSSQQFQQI